MKKLLIASLLTMSAVSTAQAEWRVSSNVDAFTDEASYTAVNPQRTGMILCNDGVGPSFGFSFPETVVYGMKFVDITVRVDNNSAHKYQAIGNDSMVSFFKIDTAYEQLLKELKAGNTLRARVIDASGQFSNHTVDLAGFTEAYDQVTKECQW